MKKLALLLLSCALLLNACKKKDDGNITVTPTSPYYFKGTLGGEAHNFTANIPQYMPFYANEVGGYQVADASLWPSFGLRLSWPSGDTVKESDLMGLIGKTLSLGDTAISPTISYGASASADQWVSVPHSFNSDYYVTISNVTFLKKDTSAGVYLKTYVIKGTCTAQMQQGSTISNLTGGEFNFVISRRDF